MNDMLGGSIYHRESNKFRANPKESEKLRKTVEEDLDFVRYVTADVLPVENYIDLDETSRYLAAAKAKKK